MISSGLQPRPGAFSLFFLPFSFRRPAKCFISHHNGGLHVEMCSLSPSFRPLGAFRQRPKWGSNQHVEPSATLHKRQPGHLRLPCPQQTPGPRIPPPSLLWLSLGIFTGKIGAGGGAAHTTARGGQGAKAALNSLLGALTSNRGRDVHRNLTTSSSSPPA